MTELVNRCLVVLVVVVAACDSSGGPCDVDQRYDRGLCYDLDAATGDAGPDASATAFGQRCGAATACGAPTDYCAIAQGAATGYCTQTGCLTVPTECPAGWSCLDLSVFSPGLPAICTRP